MPAKKSKSKKNRKLIKFISKYWFVVLALIVVIEIAAVRHFVQPPLSSGTYQHRPDTSGNVRLESLGIALKISDPLKKQGLLSMDLVDGQAGEPSASVTFTTRQLAKKYEGCNGVNGGIGSLTRYQGSSAAMPEHRHHHGSTVFDYPGFHVVYQAVMESCVASSPGYSARDIAQETTAARELWEAVKAARPL